MKKITSLLIVLTFLISLFTPVTFASANSTNSSDVKFKELESEVMTQNSGNVVTGKYEDTTTGNIHEFTIDDQEDTRTVEHIINGEFESKAVYNKSTDEVETTDKNGESVVDNANELVQEVDKEVNNDASIMSPSGSGWSMIDSKYSSTWGEYGYLYRQPVVEDTTYYELNISGGTAISTVAGIIDIIATRGGLTTILRSLGYAITGSVVDSVISGPMEATRYQDNLEVYSQGQLGLRSNKYRIVADHNGDTASVSDGGDTRTYDAMLDAGIYNVIILE